MDQNVEKMQDLSKEEFIDIFGKVGLDTRHFNQIQTLINVELNLRPNSRDQ